MRLAFALVLVAWTGRSGGAAPMLTFASDPYPGIHRETWYDADLPARIRLLEVDLTSSEIALYATKESDRGITTSDYALHVNAQIAINGGPFAINGYVPRGLAMGNSNPWSQTADDALTAVFHVRRVGERTIAGILPPESVITPADLPEGTEGVVSGRPLLVRQSQVQTQFDCSDSITIPCQPAPRTALAVSANGNTLWLVVVDGWQAGSLGLTAPQLAQFLLDRGANMAMALDGGSSSTLVINGTVVSSPSDGIERTVANHLAIKHGSLPKGELFGFICKHSIVDCPTDVPSRKISGAVVTLDDGRSQTTDTAGTYDFLSVTPRLACVTVKKAGFLTKTQCRQVVAGELQYNSVAMWEGVDPPDGGVGDDGGVPPDGTLATDARLADGGNGEATPGSGCGCETDDRLPSPLLLLVAWFLMRRRGTTG